jgi:ABC-2 type transport system permease protein
MKRLYAAVVKETLLLLRDRAGMVTLFLMPVLLVYVLTLIEDSAIEMLNEKQINLVYVDEDCDSLGYYIKHGLDESGAFSLIDSLEGKPATASAARTAVLSGKYPVCVIIPHGATDTMLSNARVLVKKTFRDMGMTAGKDFDQTYDTVKIQMFFDPAVKNSLRAIVSGAVGEYSSKTEARAILNMFSATLTDLLPEGKEVHISYPQMIHLDKQYAFEPESTLKPNSTQHNVPSWTLFAMFFIVIPLAGSIIQEKQGGTYLRLVSMPRTATATFSGKIIVYFIVCLLQVSILFSLGAWVIPYTGLPELQFGNNLSALFMVVVSAAFAAVSFGFLVGTISSSYQQAASIGVVLIIIMASLGGLWMPIYLMPKAVQGIMVYSPLNWALSGFYDFFLRNADIKMVLPEVLKVFTFGAGMFLLALTIRSAKKIK